jgi:hypothetical protein
MAVEPEILAESRRWIDMDLDEIMMRHDFLRKAGRYTTPDPKRPQIEMVCFSFINTLIFRISRLTLGSTTFSMRALMRLR